jgi:fructoselysine-6-P-deglycase FrlB-like protein
VVWDPKGQTNVGTKSADTALAEMATFAFGYPWAQQVAADEVLVTFWCTASCVTHIQWRRLYITEERAK